LRCARRGRRLRRSAARFGRHHADVLDLRQANVTNTGSITGGVRGITIGAGGSSVFNAGTISGGGGTAIRFAGIGNTLTLAQGSAITGNVLGTGSDTFQLGGTGTATFDVSQIGAAAQYRGFGTFNKIDSSAWTLTGTSTFAGPINVNGGTLSVNGNVTSASGVTVNAGGTLAGTGTVGATTIASGGTLQAGSGTAGSSLNITGALGMNAGSTYAVNLNPSTSSFANVSGAATLGGATVNAIFAPGSSIARQYTILNAGSISGTFGTLANTNLPANFTDTLSYDATHAYLNLTLAFIAPPTSGLSGNQSNVGNALINSFNTNGGIPLVFGGLTANGLSQASGQPGASTAQPGMAATGQFVNAIFDGAFGDNGGQGGAIGFAADETNAYAANSYTTMRKLSREAKDAYAAVTPRDRLASPVESRWNVWASAYGGNSRVSGDSTAGTSATTSRIFGAMTGASYRVSPNTQLGFALGGAGSNFNLDGGFGGGKADIFNAAVYARHTIGAHFGRRPAARIVQGAGAGRAAGKRLALCHAGCRHHALRRSADDDVLSAGLRGECDLRQQYVCAGLRREDRHRDPRRTRRALRPGDADAGRRVHAQGQNRLGARLEHRPQRHRDLPDFARRYLHDQRCAAVGQRRARVARRRDEMAQWLVGRRLVR
jgi:uncharacterized protein with beta-barrel porin domain